MAETQKNFNENKLSPELNPELNIVSVSKNERKKISTEVEKQNAKIQEIITDNLFTTNFDFANSADSGENLEKIVDKKLNNLNFEEGKLGFVGVCGEGPATDCFIQLADNSTIFLPRVIALAHRESEGIRFGENDKTKIDPNKGKNIGAWQINGNSLYEARRNYNIYKTDGINYYIDNMSFPKIQKILTQKNINYNEKQIKNLIKKEIDNYINENLDTIKRKAQYDLFAHLGIILKARGKDEISYLNSLIKVKNGDNLYITLLRDSSVDETKFISKLQGGVSQIGIKTKENLNKPLNIFLRDAADNNYGKDSLGI